MFPNAKGSELLAILATLDPSSQAAGTATTGWISVANHHGLLAAASQASAQALVAETDPQAKALAYVADATKVDKAKQPKFVAGSNCGNCALFQGKASDAAGGCPLFAGKKVASKGWCNAWAKKA